MQQNNSLVDTPSFQAYLFKALLGYLPTVNYRGGKSYVFDSQSTKSHEDKLRDFFQINYPPTACMFKGRQSPQNDAVLNKLKSLVSPENLLGRDTQRMNGSFFFTIFPYEKVGLERWADVFKSTLARRRFKIPFMYAGTDGRAVRLVFSVYHEQNPIITTKGLGQLISNEFLPPNPDGSRSKTFIPVLRLDEKRFPQFLTIILGHIAKLRVSTNPEQDKFNTGNPITGDAGDAFYAMFVQLIRATSCARMIRGLYQSLHQPLKDEFKRETQRCMDLLGIKFNFDWAQEQWDNIKMCSAVSLLIQARNFRHADTDETDTAHDRLLCSLREFFALYPSADHPSQTYMTVQSSKQDSNSLFHVLVIFPWPIKVVGPQNVRKVTGSQNVKNVGSQEGHLGQFTFSDWIQQLVHRIGFATLMSVTPVDLDDDGNLLAQAIISLIDPQCSAKRDAMIASFSAASKQMDDFSSGAARTASLPAPRQPSLSRKRSVPITDVDTYEQASKTAHHGSMLSVTAPEFRPTPRDQVGNRMAGELLRGWIREAGLTGNKEEDSFRMARLGQVDGSEDIILFIHVWIQDVSGLQVFPPHLTDKNTAGTVTRNAIIMCTKILAEAMDTCARALHYVTRNIAKCIFENEDTLSSVSFDLGRAVAACNGLEPVLTSFRHIKTDGTLSFPLDPRLMPVGSPVPALPYLIAKMSRENPIRNIYENVWDAHHRIAMMKPEEPMAVSWDRIMLHFRELLVSLHAAKTHCKLLQETIQGSFRY